MKHYGPSREPKRKEPIMELGMTGLGRIRNAMVQRLPEDSERRVVYNLQTQFQSELVSAGAIGLTSREYFVNQL
jgi:6-phosphogluconate dehydrogenase (decarboxylating)